jgi:hypothetical protein
MFKLMAPPAFSNRSGKVLMTSRVMDRAAFFPPRRNPPDTEETAMSRYCQELTLSDAMTDPMIRGLMKADGVDPRELETSLREMARLLQRRKDDERRPGSAQLSRVVAERARADCVL